jgi:hypothetical protein
MMFTFWLLLQIPITFVVSFNVGKVPIVVLSDVFHSYHHHRHHVVHVQPIQNSGDDEELDQFERDLLEAFGEDDRDEAAVNAAYAAFARDLQNVGEIDEWGKWKEDIQEDDVFITEQEAVQFYSEIMDDMTKIQHFDTQIDTQGGIPDDEKQLVDDVIAAANRAMESIWKDQKRGSNQ